MNFKLENNFAAEIIEGETYILPFGQNIAMQRKGVKLNPTGEYLWSLMEKTQDYSEILHSFYHYYEAGNEEDRRQLKADLDEFLNDLKAHRIIRDLGEEQRKQQMEKTSLSIGGLGISLAIPKEYIHPYFLDFTCDILPKHSILVCLERFTNRGMSDGEVLIRTDEMIILEKEGSVIFDYKLNSFVKELIYEVDTKTAYLRLVENAKANEAKEEIFFAIRNAFLYYAAKHHRFAIHSASLIYKDKAWLFSGHSGAGKSTHTALWKKLFDVKDLNGDLNLLGFEDNRAVVYGMPWCGTSKIYTNETYPLGGIVFLSQGEKNELLPLSKSEKPLYIMQRMISPAWTKRGLDNNLDMAKRLVAFGIGVWSFRCTKNDEAAEFMKKEIDQWNS
ncbi:MAG: PqqD family protein [Lachnospiraceae bacterium]|nr:PqqD family protein [Lachnospiraceae bacterium]